MTNERWRAEMPKWWHRDVDAIVTRANAELDAAEAREASLKQGNLELRALLEASWESTEKLESEKVALTKERDELKAQTVSLVGTLVQAALDKVESDERITALESELAARRASDEDVRKCAESMRFYRPGAPEAANRLLAADWLKKEGGS